MAYGTSRRELEPEMAGESGYRGRDGRYHRPGLIPVKEAAKTRAPAPASD